MWPHAAAERNGRVVERKFIRAWPAERQGQSKRRRLASPPLLNGAVNLWYTRGLHSFDAAVDVAPRFPQAHMARGDALRTLGRNQEAAASYERAAKWTVVAEGGAEGEAGGGPEAHWLYRQYEATRRMGLSLVDAATKGENEAASGGGGGDGVAAAMVVLVAAGSGGRNEPPSGQRRTSALQRAAAMRPSDAVAQADRRHRHIGRAGRQRRALQAGGRGVCTGGGAHPVDRSLQEGVHARAELHAERLRRESKAGGWSRDAEARLRNEQARQSAKSEL